ncbi:hypothetical protein CDL15_Pgr016782 [Punica granatum]|uniref:Myb/SANT-like domain-containing protein n=2 Tax=Punica granatum TaxID=22663 RepID=A0A218WWZ1_PUNGR|nr:hypothetical protein CDL15_Pgr016782 [Punica granatum]
MTVEIGKQFSDEHMYSQKMKEKATRLKTMYKQSIRVRWDEDTNTINASPDVWDMFIKKNKAFKTFRTRGCKHYRLLNELFSASTAIDALRISSTDRLRTSDEERQLHEEFLSISKKKHKQTINLEKGSDESDDPVQFQIEAKEHPTVVKEKQVRFKSLEQPKRNSIEEVMAELDKLKVTIPLKSYIAGSLALLNDKMRRLFMYYVEDTRREWLHIIFLTLYCVWEFLGEGEERRGEERGGRRGEEMEE